MIDFLIIGGGIAGVSAAARLAPHGSVALVEAEAGLGYHASGRSAAMYLKSYGNDVVRELNAASEDHLVTCAGGGVLGARGVLTVGRADQTDLIRAACQAGDTHAVTLDEAFAMAPILNRDAVAAAAYVPDARDLDTDRLIQDYAATARGAGAVLRTDAAVEDIAGHRDHWQVTLRPARRSELPTTLEARTIVNAAGAWADRVAERAGLPPLGLTAFRRSVARVPAPGGHDVTRWPFLLGAAEDWYARPDAGKWLISPAEEDPQPPHDAYPEDIVLAEGIARYEAMVTEPVRRMESSWAGLRTFAPDRTPVLGPDPLDRAFVWCAGQGGYGFQTSAAAAAVLEHAVTGTPAPVGASTVAALSPARFR